MRPKGAKYHSLGQRPGNHNPIRKQALKGRNILFATTKQNVSLHVQNVLKEGDLSDVSVVKESLTVQTKWTRKVHRRTPDFPENPMANPSIE